MNGKNFHRMGLITKAGVVINAVKIKFGMVIGKQRIRGFEMKLINANIQSVEEALHRLVDGEVFYTEVGNKLYFNPVAKVLNDMFRISGYTVDTPINESFNRCEEWKVEEKWWEGISEDNQVLCFVWDGAIKPKNAQAAWVKEKNGHEFLTHGNMSWANAQPVTAEDLK